MLIAIEKTRLHIAKNTTAQKKAQLGQFFTPARTARYMAGLFHATGHKNCRLLDAGAGIGSLSSAFIERCMTGDLAFSKVEITAFELDHLLHADLAHTFASYAEQIPLGYEMIGGDFIEEAVNRIQFGNNKGYSHAILNPPYKKINSNSRHRALLRQVGIETVNLYSAFVALALAMMAPGGQVVAIIPRSFCNGPYYHPFRSFILQRAAIRQIHLFKSRDKAFKDDSVLQENIIIVLERDGQQNEIKITTSTDDSFLDLVEHIHPFGRIVFADDPERFIHIPTLSAIDEIGLNTGVHHTLEELGIQVSTGPVVDFRLKSHLRNFPEKGTVPLLYPIHFNGQTMEWPKIDIKKPNAIQRNGETEKWLFPTGSYCVVRRFSSKEEKRRIMASVVQPKSFNDAEMLGFENHLNVFHENKRGLPEALARGLAIFLNTTAVDECFRRFNGHTQVNATDLRLMKYPSRAMLIALGNATKDMPQEQPEIDRLVTEMQEA
ncbi:MAG: Eco57I restriction-modification methylase domain-containing protein [Gallionellaceae bacterium]|nr:Eco57I restriction-modification methylase domain-containing protein [Gallionellaceae bacterium]